MRRARPLFLALSATILIGSCVGDDTPTDVGGAALLDIPVSPALIPTPADGGAAPINRIRARVTRVSDNVVLGQTQIDVDPDAEQWEVLLKASVGGRGPVDVTVFVLLIHATGDVESVEFSGLVGPLTLTAGQTVDAADVPIVRGPIANFFTTGVTISSAPGTLGEGATASLSAAATTSGSVPPTVFWTVLDSAVLSSSGSEVTGLAPGVGRVVASAGMHADTASITVVPAPASVVVTPDTAFVVGVGSQATFEAVVVDARGDPVPGETVAWSSGTPQIIESAGDGVFTALATGDGVVRAAAASDPSVVGTAVLVVAAASGPDVAITVGADDTTPAVGDVVQITIDVLNRVVPGGADVTSLVVEATGSPELDLRGYQLTQGTFDQDADSWSVGSLAVGASARLTLDIEITGGTLGQSLTGTAWIASLDQAQSDLTNDTATVTLTIADREVDVAVLKKVDEPQPLAGTTVTFTVSLANNGPGTVTGLSVFDSLAAQFLDRSDVVSSGTLVGDTLWTVPSLAEGDTATWTTTATVSPDAAGGSATNTAVLRSIDQSDTTPANDMAAVAINFPISAIPVVQITAPADGAVFDPGDPVTFTGTANDAEEGDLSASIAWASDEDGPLGTGASLTTSQLTTGVHVITASATDSDGGTGSASIEITIALITTPATLNVPFGGTASLPITLSEPAPPGGFTLSVTSGDPSITAPTAATVFIPGGAQSANATLQGLQPGTTDVTVSHPQFGSSVTTVSVTAGLNITVGSLVVPETFPQTIDIRLESLGAPIAAPAGGLVVTLTSNDPTCATAPTNVTIAEGLVQQSATISYGGGATLTCTTRVRASAPSVTPDSVNVSVTAAPALTPGAATVGAGLQYGQLSTALGTTAHGGVTVTVTSEDPSIMRLSLDANTPGTASIQYDVLAGQNRAYYYVQGVEGTTGTASLVATAPGFRTDSALVTVVQPAIDIQGLVLATTVFAVDDAFYVRTGIPNAQNTGLSINQAPRAGSPPLTVTIESSQTSVADLITLPDSASPVTVELPAGAFNTPTNVASGGVALETIGAGSTVVSATIPGYLQTTAAVRTVDVTLPDITGPTTTVGAGLQQGQVWATLGATGHGGAAVTVTSADPSVALVSPDATTPGTPSIVVDVADGQNRAFFYVQGVEGQTGVVPLRITANGFTDGSGQVTVASTAYEIISLPSSTTSFSPNSQFFVRAGVPNAQNTGLSSAQAVRAGGDSLFVTVTSSEPTVADVATLTEPTSPVTTFIAPTQFNTPSYGTGGVTLDPIGAGTTTISAAIDGLIATDGASRQVTVTAPGISVGSTPVGAGLQYGTLAVTLGATNHPGVVVRIESGDPSRMRVSLAPDQAGTDFVEASVPTGQTRVNYFIHGVEGTSGDVPLTVSAPGFVTATATISVVQPGVEIIGLVSTETTLSPNRPFQVRIGVPYTQLTGLQIVQSVRTGGAPLTATVTNSSAQVARLATNAGAGQTATVTIQPGSSSSPTTLLAGGVEFDPQAIGSTNVNATIPGFLQLGSSTQTVTVSAPGITVPTLTVGAGLQYGNTGIYATLGASQHGGRTVTVRSSNPSVLRISPDQLTAGAQEIQIDVPNGQNRVYYYVQGVEGASAVATVTVSAVGFTDGSNAIDVVPPALDISGLATSRSAGAADDPFVVRVGVPSANNSTLSIVQAVRAGGTPLTATVVSSSPAAARLVTMAVPGGAASVTVEIGVGLSTSASTVDAGGVALDPVAEGSTSVSATIPGVIATGQATVSVTITP